MKKYINPDLLVTQWPPKGQSMSLGQWSRQVQNRYNVSCKNIIHWGLPAATLRDLRSGRRSQVPTLGRFCAAVAELAGCDYDNLFKTALALHKAMPARGAR